MSSVLIHKKFSDEHFMQRCIDVAKMGVGTTYPNPCVGCIIVYKNKIISEAYSKPYGYSHAEINAINNIEDKSILKDCSLYVTLEPCCHYGKTPPCCDEIIKYDFSKVIIGIIDPSEKVNGKGIEKLKLNGIDVKTSILENECKTLHRNFINYHTKKSPYIILKWAESNDGYISPSKKNRNKPYWISCKKSRQLVHKWRSSENSILVGYNTVVEDNPKLTTRHFGGKNPIRIVLDPKNKLKDNFKVFDSKSKTIKVTLKKENCDKKYIYNVLNYLYEMQIQSIIVEGGQKTLELFIKNNKWDEARIFVAKKNLKDGKKSPKIYGKITDQYNVGSDLLKIMVPN